jgi:transposase
LSPYRQAAMLHSDAYQDPAEGIRFRRLKRNVPLRLPLDRLIPDDHPARHVLAVAAALDFTDLLQPIRAREGQPGAPVFDPRMLFALWLYACIDGVSSARELADRCRRDLPFLWLSGQTRPNYHTLADFYSDNQAFLETAFTEHLEVLLAHKLITLTEVTLDGRKIPANAGKESFHRDPTLSRHRREAEDHLAKLTAQRAAEGGPTSRKRAAQQRAATDRQRRLEAAMAVLQRRQAERAERTPRKGEAPPAEIRASETDADARKMKLSHGGYAPAYNTQTVTDTANGLIVTVRVTDQGSDGGLLQPLLEQVKATTGRQPTRALVDAGYVSATDIEALEGDGLTLYMPPKKEREDLKKGKDPYARKRWDTPVVAGWRARMGTAEAKAIYKRRAPVAEGVHAQQSNRGWRRYRLRGLVKAGCEALWQALAHNLSVLIARKTLPRLAVRTAEA